MCVAKQSSARLALARERERDGGVSKEKAQFLEGWGGYGVAKIRAARRNHVLVFLFDCFSFF